MDGSGWAWKIFGIYMGTSLGFKKSMIFHLIEGILLVILGIHISQKYTIPKVSTWLGLLTTYLKTKEKKKASPPPSPVPKKI